MAKQIAKFRPLILIIRYHGFDQFLNLITNNPSVSPCFTEFHFRLEVLIFWQKVLPRIFSINHPIVNYPKRINITLCRVVLLKSYLWRCSTQCPNVFVHEFRFFENRFGITEISYFQNSVIDQNVARFEVTMSDILRIHRSETVQ